MRALKERPPLPPPGQTLARGERFEPLLARLRAFTGDDTFEDDICMVSMQLDPRLPEAETSPNDLANGTANPVPKG